MSRKHGRLVQDSQNIQRSLTTPPIAIDGQPAITARLTRQRDTTNQLIRPHLQEVLI